MKLYRSADYSEPNAHMVDELTAAAQERAREARDVATREAARIGDLARDWWHRYANTALDAAATVKDEASAAGNKARLYVRDEPVKSVLGAVVLGAVIAGIAVYVARRRS